MRLKEKRENFYVEWKIKSPDTCKWGAYVPCGSKDTVGEAEDSIKDMIMQDKEHGCKSSALGKYRIMKRVEKHYIVKTVVGG